MSLANQMRSMSVESYLNRELASPCKHELIDGQIYAMAGASANHERIAINIIRKFANHLEGGACEPFGSDMKVRVLDNFYYPDVLVDCHFDDSEPYYTTSPVIIVEIISRSTRKMDEKTKFLEYINIPTLLEYVIIEQDIADITVCRKSDDWRATHYFLGEAIDFESIHYTLSVEEIYYRVQNEDVKAYIESKQVES